MADHLTGHLLRAASHVFPEREHRRMRSAVRDYVTDRDMEGRDARIWEAGAAATLSICDEVSGAHAPIVAVFIDRFLRDSLGERFPTGDRLRVTYFALARILQSPQVDPVAVREWFRDFTSGA